VRSVSCTPRRLHTAYAPHRLHTVDSTGRRRPARVPCLLRDPPSSHSRLHCPSASCACAAPLARPTVFTQSTPLAVGVLRVLADAGILATSCMHPHKNTPIVDLPLRVSHPRNCRLNALEVILRCPQEPPPPKPLSPIVHALWLLPAHAAAKQRLPGRPRPPSCASAHAPPSSHHRLQWPSASCACTSSMH
jgi:hypothetical protein